MISWAKTRYGIAVIAAVTTAGGLWFSESRRHVTARDVVELAEAMEERWRAVHLDQTQTVEVIEQNVKLWTTNVVDPRYWFTYSGGDVVRSNEYLYRNGDTNITYTNGIQFYRFGYPTIEYYNTPTTVRTGRFIWAGWESIVISNLSYAGSPSPADGEEFFRHEVQPSYYTQGTPYSSGTEYWVLKDLGHDAGWRVEYTDFPDPTTGPSSWDYITTSAWYQCEAGDYTFVKPWQAVVDPYGVGLDLEYYDIPQAEGIGVNLNDDYIKDVTATYMEHRYQAFTRTKTPTEFWAAFDAVLLNELVGNFVKEVDTNDGSVVYHTVTGLFDQLEIGDGTNLFTRTPERGTNDAVYGLPGRITREIHVAERYKILNALTVTVANAYWYTNVGSAHSTNEAVLVSDDEAEVSLVPFIPQTPPPDAPEIWHDLPVDGNPLFADGIWLDTGGILPVGGPTDVTAEFFTDYYPISAKTFDGLPHDDADTNAFSDIFLPPIYHYNWDYYIYKIQRAAWLWNDYWSAWILTAGVDYTYRSVRQRYEYDYSNSLASIAFDVNQDLTGVTYRAELWVNYEQRTNTAEDAWFVVSNYHPHLSSTWVGELTNSPRFDIFTNDGAGDPVYAYTTNITDVQTSLLFGVGYDEDDVEEFVYDETETDRNWRAQAFSPFQWYNVDFYFDATHFVGNNTNQHYYGKRMLEGPTLLYWDFMRANEPYTNQP